MQEVRKVQNQDLRADPVWSISSGKMESNPGHSPGFRRRRAAAISGFRDTMTLRCWNLPLVGQLLVDEPGGLAIPGPVCPRSSWAARRWSLPRRGTGERSVQICLPVSLLMVLHALRLECKKSMEWTASSHRSCLSPSCRESMNKTALSESVPTGAQMKER